MVGMLVYVWSRENPNAQINIYGLVQLRVCNFTTIDCNSHLRVAQLVNRQSKRCGPVDNMRNWLVVDVLSSFAGILSSLGYGLIGYDIWVSINAWPSGHHGWTSILLLFSVAPSCHRKELPQDSEMGVSFYTVMAKAFYFSLHIYTTKINFCAIATLFLNTSAPCLLNLMHLHRHKIVARYRIGMQANAPVRPPPANGNAGTGAFRGRSYRLNQ